MENQIPTVSTQPVVNTQQAVIPEQPKKSNFLTILLSILLFLAVVIAAFFAYQTQKLSNELNTLKLEPESVFPMYTEPNESVDDPTADWKTYTSTELSFSFRYPGEWTWIKRNDIVLASFDTKSGTPDEFFVAYHKDVDDLSKWLLDNQAGKIIDDINVNGNQFSVIKGGTLNVSQEYAIKVGNNSYLRLVIDPFPNSVVSTNLINQILSTFKFTN